MTDKPSKDSPTPPKSGLGGLVSAARKGQSEPPQSELNAAKPESDDATGPAPVNEPEDA